EDRPRAGAARRPPLDGDPRGRRRHHHRHHRRRLRGRRRHLRRGNGRLRPARHRGRSARPAKGRHAMTRHALSLLGLLALGGCGIDAAPVRVGADAPDARVVDLATGDTLSLTEHYGGQVTLVNIWATWCGPCKEEIPALDSLYRELGPRGL